MINRRLGVIAVVLFPLAVISFALKKQETNFNLEEFYGPSIEYFDSSKYEERNYSIRLSSNGSNKTLDLEDYVIGVVAGEMPASFDSEALKAQAVASRTYALYKKQKSGLEFDLTNGTNTQVYIEKDTMVQKWGEDYQKYYEKIRDAVLETKGQVLTYGGSLIEAFYFAMSSGNTNESASVFGEARDYLQSVVSEYDNTSLNGYEVKTEMSVDEFKSKLGLNCNRVTIDNISRSSSHYVDSINVCSQVLRGTAVRTKLGLRSADFDITIGDAVNIVTRGYGHGVGMSQYGANGYASVGYTYDEILKHYYQGVEIKDIKDV